MLMEKLEPISTQLEKSSPLVIKLNSSEASAGKESSLPRQCTASLCIIHHFLHVVDFFPEKHIVPTGQRYSR